jgi:hypothetical protein
VLAIALHVLVGLIVAWDLYASFGGYPQYTVSAILTGWAEGRPILPLVLGIVLGHLFWGRWPSDTPRGG